jgi:dihydroxyacetone kinase
MSKTNPASRIAAAKRLHVATAARIAELEQIRRAAILADDDSLAEQQDYAIANERLLLRRLAEKIDWLGQAPSNQLPETVEAMRAEIEKCRARHAQLKRKPRLDRSAAEDDELQSLVPHVSMLTDRLRHMESMGRG